MTRKFLIAGSIVDTGAERETFEDVTPAQVNAFLTKLEDGDDVEIEITSYGGSVSAGLAICNLLKKASAEGHRTTSHVIGLAASMASAIACACDEMKMDANAFLMVHNPWTLAMGNAGDLRKEADTLDQYRDALLAIYRTKFDASDEVLRKMLDDETWIIGSSAQMFMLDCEVIPTAEPLRAAAFAGQMPKFINTPKALKEIIMEKEEELKKADQAEQSVEAAADETADETAAGEEPKEEPAAEDAAELEPEIVETVPKAEADRRVSGMQSAMAKQMDAMKKDYEAKIEDFKVQIKAKDEELTKAKAEVTSLSESLEKSEKELSEMTSAFKEKADALDALNASVNTPAAVESKPWKKLHGEDLLKWCRENAARKH